MEESRCIQIKVPNPVHIWYLNCNNNSLPTCSLRKRTPLLAPSRRSQETIFVLTGQSFRDEEEIEPNSQNLVISLPNAQLRNLQYRLLVHSSIPLKKSNKHRNKRHTNKPESKSYSSNSHSSSNTPLSRSRKPPCH